MGIYIYGYKLITMCRAVPATSAVACRCYKNVKTPAPSLKIPNLVFLFFLPSAGFLLESFIFSFSIIFLSPLP